MRCCLLRSPPICQVKRHFSTNSSSKLQFSKSYESIPGPRGPFGLGNLYKYLPIVGSYTWLELHKAGHDKYREYGPIVKETMVPGQDIVWLYDPQDIATLLNCKDFPLRRSHLALAKYRTDRPHIYRSAGLLPTNGAEWWRLRSELQKEISVPKNVRSFLLEIDEVTKEFLDYLPKSETVDVLPKLARLNLELTCLVTFGERLNSFSPEEQAENARSSKLMWAAETTNSNILPTDQGLGLWRHFETGPYKKIRKAQEYMESVAVDLVSQKLAFFKDTSDEVTESPCSLSRTSLVEQYLKNPNLDLNDVVGMAADLLLAGVDTTSYTTAFALYHISRHPEVQRRIHEESCKVLPSKSSPLLAESLNSGIPFTRACLKEVYRLNPISVGVGRILTKDMVFSGYLVPKDTVVVTQNMVACRLEQNFEKPLIFNPDRWLRETKASINPYLVLPFGHGMRSCIARRLAEQNILTLLLRLIRNFEIEWKGDDEPMDVITLLINKPSKPVTIELRERPQ